MKQAASLHARPSQEWRDIKFEYAECCFLCLFTCGTATKVLLCQIAKSQYMVVITSMIAKHDKSTWRQFPWSATATSMCVLGSKILELKLHRKQIFSKKGPISASSSLQWLYVRAISLRNLRMSNSKGCMIIKKPGLFHECFWVIASLEFEAMVKTVDIQMSWHISRIYATS